MYTRTLYYLLFTIIFVSNAFANIVDYITNISPDTRIMQIGSKPKNTEVRSVDNQQEGLVTSSHVENAYSIKAKPLVVENIMKLRDTPVVVNQIVRVLGYYKLGDGGGGVFKGVKIDLGVDNEGTIIVPKGAVSGYAWERAVSKDVNILWFGAKGDGLSDNTEKINAALKLIKNQGGGRLIIPYGYYGGNYFLKKAPYNNFIYFKIDFPNLSIYAEKQTRFTLANSSDGTRSTLFYITRSFFKASGISVFTQGDLSLNFRNHVGVRVFCVTDDDAIGISYIKIENSMLVNGDVLFSGFPKKGEGISNITISDCYTEQAVYGINFTASDQAANEGIISKIAIKNFKTKNVYRSVIFNGHGEDIEADVRQLDGHDNIDLGGGTTICFAVPRVKGYGWRNVTVRSTLEDDYARNVLLSTLSDPKDMSVFGKIYEGRYFKNFDIIATSKKGKSSYVSNFDYNVYIANFNVETNRSVPNTLSVSYENFRVYSYSPVDLSHGRLPLFSSFKSTIKPLRMVFYSVVDLYPTSDAKEIDNLASSWTEVFVNGKEVLSFK